MTVPLRFCLGLHLHQPVGNFDSVFADHLRTVYRPLLDGLERGGAWPVALHVSGPLLDWCERHGADWLDRIGELVAADRIELLSAGHDEPILAVLDPADRIEQILRHRDRLDARFGVSPRGLWLTERVWEPDLPASLAEAGVEFVLVDDRHLRVTGLPVDARHRPWRTEFAGAGVTVFAIDQNLRYLVPFRPPEELAAYLSTIAASGHALAVLADDGEKFGGWPGTAEWVWRDGWFDRFTAELERLRAADQVMLSRFDAAADTLPAAGPVYIPSASYLEMERWALPAALARELAARETADPAVEADPLLRGGHWRHFLVKYPESNRLHKVMQLLSAECRRRGDPVTVRHHIGRAQCNDAYWHGVFGGLYLPFLRSALWRELAQAARLLCQGAPPAATMIDVDADGRLDVLITSPTALHVIAPARGGAIEVSLDLIHGGNLADALTRHEESYHQVTPVEPVEQAPEANAEGHAATGTASIHDAETQAVERPPVDRDTRALLVDRFLDATTSRDSFVAGLVHPVRSLADLVFTATIDPVPHGVAIRMTGVGVTKTIVIHNTGPIDVHWQWDAGDEGAAWFSTELSLATVPDLIADGAERWDYPIETVSRSEAGFDRNLQGTAVVLRWPVARGSASLRIGVPPSVR
jgi:alpha-amylase